MKMKMKSCHSSVKFMGSDIGKYLNTYVSESVVTLDNTRLAAGPEREMVRSVKYGVEMFGVRPSYTWRTSSIFRHM